MRATVIKTAAALILPLISWATAGGVSPELNSPRIGDRLDIAVLAGPPSFTDSLRLCPDLSDISVRHTEQLSVWAAAPGDTLTAMCITQGRKTEELVFDGGVYLCRTRQTPGFYRRYDSAWPYSVIKEDSQADTVSASGRADGISSYRTSGRYRMTTASGLRIVTPDGDIAGNVECVIREVDDRMFFDGDSTVCIHRGTDKAWYVPGYRYPVLRQQHDLLLSEEGDTIDSRVTWEALALSEQEAVIDNDPVNSEIRRLIKEQKDAPGNNSRNTSDKDRSKGRLHQSVSIDYAANTVSINRTPGDSRFIDMMLCDIGGRVYQSRVFGDDAQAVTLSLDGLAPSTYLIYIRTTDGPIICKFNL